MSADRVILLVGGAVGGFVAGYVAWRAALAAARRTLEDAARVAAAEGEAEDAPGNAAHRERLAAGLRAEMETFVATYMEGLGSQVELLAPGQVLIAARPPQEYYFTMYDSNASGLAEVFAPAEVDRIVRFYGRAKGLVDALRGWEAASMVEYAGEEDRLAAMSWAVDRLRQAHREVQRILPEALRALGGDMVTPTPEGAVPAPEPADSGAGKVAALGESSRARWPPLHSAAGDVVRTGL